MRADYQDQAQYFHSRSRRHKAGDWRSRPEKCDCAQNDAPSRQEQQKTGNSHSAKFRITDSAYHGAREDTGFFR